MTKLTEGTDSCDLCASNLFNRKSGENIFAEDVKQLALFFGGWLDQMFKQKKYSDTLFVVWLFLKLKQCV